MATKLSEQINVCFMRFRDRAERIDSKEIARTFVSVGPLFNVLRAENDRVLYGRRGAGKTHALLYLAEQVRQNGDIAVHIECHRLGSNNSIYNDQSLGVAERATRLLI